MLNIVLVGYGNQPEVAKMASTVQKELQKIIVNMNANVYNSDTTWKIEANPELFKKKGRLRFTTSTTKYKTYYGIIGDVNYDDLYQKWFSPAQNTYPHGMPPYYSKYNLSVALDNIFSKNVNSNAKDFYMQGDFVISYRYDVTEEWKAFCIIEYSVDQNKLNDIDILNQFRHLIVTLDETCPNAFVSAYISNNEKYPIANLSLCTKFKADELNSKILGAEYSVYINNSMQQANKYIAPQISDYYTAVNLSNGVQYTSNVDLKEFSIEPVLEYFNNITIPAYEVSHWSALWGCKERYYIKPEMISVYHDKYDPTNPTIVFSSHYSPDEIDNLPMLQDDDIKERYILKNTTL